MACMEAKWKARSITAIELRQNGQWSSSSSELVMRWKSLKWSKSPAGGMAIEQREHRKHWLPGVGWGRLVGKDAMPGGGKKFGGKIVELGLLLLLIFCLPFR